MQNGEQYLQRWHKAGLLDDTTLSSIRQYEQTQAKPAGRQWQVLLALILGGILLGAGILLFVAAHWDQVSPISRLLLVLGMLIFFHGLGLLFRERFGGLSTAMHAIGTVSAGAAIALVGQIFNMQEHWPSAVMLWALCAAAGWALLRDQFQETLTLLLLPAWIICEYADKSNHYAGGEVYLARVLAVVGAAYLVSFLRTRKQVLFGLLFAAGAITLTVSTGLLSEGWTWYSAWGFLPARYRVFAITLIVLTCLLAFARSRLDSIPVFAVAIAVFILPWLQSQTTANNFGHTWTHSEPNVFFYSLVATISVFFAWWGVHRTSKALVNFGMVAFALIVFWFYFSNVMDKLDRSLGLIVLGVLFLAGGWALEKTRRRLIQEIAGGAK